MPKGQRTARVAEPGHTPVTLDAAVRRLFEASWGKARQWIETGKVAVEGRVVTDPRAVVSRGAEVVLDMNARRPRPMRDLPEGAIVHADAHVVVVEKPAGVMSVPFEDREQGTLDARVRAHIERLPGQKRGARPDLGIVHRLDRGTSGLLVFARTWTAKERLARQFRAHTVHRRYLAVVLGQIMDSTIRSHLVADRGDGIRGSLERAPWSVRRRAGEGKLAVTHVEVLERLRGATLVACRLETGRTHQIRIHLSEAGHHIVGEFLYVPKDAAPSIRADRPMLHAAELGFVHPGTGREVRFVSPLPEDMQALLARLR